MARCAPKSHNGIADELVYRAAFLFDAGGDEREVFIDELGNLDSGHSFACRCELTISVNIMASTRSSIPEPTRPSLMKSHDQCARR